MYREKEGEEAEMCSSKDDLEVKVLKREVERASRRRLDYCR